MSNRDEVEMAAPRPAVQVVMHQPVRISPGLEQIQQKFERVTKRLGLASRHAK